MANKDSLRIDRISYQDAKPFILNIHYARRMPSISYAFGLFLGDEMIGVCTYGQPASPSLCVGIAGPDNKRSVLELNRLVLIPIKDRAKQKNLASYFVAHTLKMLPSRTFCVSYADWGGWHHVGYVYQATNWLFTGTTKPRTDKYSEGHSRHYAEGETRRQYRTAKHRYVYLVGNKRQKKEMLAELKYPVFKEYPKGESRHYDTDNPVPAINLKNWKGISIKEAE